MFVVALTAALMKNSKSGARDCVKPAQKRCKSCKKNKF